MVKDNQIKIFAGVVVVGAAAWFFMKAPEVDVQAAQAQAAKVAEKMHAEGSAPPPATGPTTPPLPGTPPASVNAQPPPPTAAAPSTLPPAVTAAIAAPAVTAASDLPPPIPEQGQRDPASFASPPGQAEVAPPPNLAKDKPLAKPDVASSDKCPWTYTVDEESDSMFSVARRFGRESAWAALAKSNNISTENARSLKRGHTICVNFGD